MFEKLLAAFSMAVFGVFLVILGLRVEEAPILPFVLAATFAMGVYDFWRELFSGRKRKKDENSLL
ncbi:MAG: hypothetical protein AB7F96_15285 [Beijerinckiaceae bacterium]